MQPIRIFVALALAAAALAAAAPPPADGAGGPILPVVASGEDGIESADGMYRYVTLFGSPETTVAKVTKGTGEIDAWTRQAKSKYGGGYGIPQVAADGAVGGLSADGETLVLMRAFGPIDRAGLAVLGTNRLHTKNRIELKGQYSFDAISPDGRTAYVIEYPQPFRYDRYRVLKLNLKSGRLSKEPIVDTDVGLEEEEEKHEGEEGVEGEMRGLALSRVSSADGRWAYTLYDGGGGANLAARPL